ncbi:HBR553Cp [Eremothecium sinecaudum]|uniref:Cysteine proteinase 1, mitochondrial n=1 Tax=Eremothecium sinecaudum TaxID=45286 RepID=A0A120K1J3_9SACH|nr:HBR553Cp [Eremothecium sinecaudum]AMD19454.1 HBR553Cp [Eremothecium sinecaudum]
MKTLNAARRLSQLYRRTKPTNLMSIKTSDLTKWTKEFQEDGVHNLAATVLKNNNADDALLDKRRLQVNYPRVFNTGITDEVGPVTNQRSTGRCWLFAATNGLRLNVARKLNLKEFELSQSYLFFYDKLEKANYFLDQIVDTHKEDLDGRLVQYFLSQPINDGGQYSMFVNLVRKYGLLPKDLFADLSFTSTSSSKCNSLLMTKMREYAQVLREALAKGEDVTEMRENMQREIVKMLTLFIDIPPVQPDEEFVWDYVDKEGKVGTVRSTPLEFAKEYAGFDESKPVSLINDPRHPYGEFIHIDRLCNVVGGDPVFFLNVDNETLTDLLVKRLKAKKGVFFGSHTPKFMSKTEGVLDIDLWNYKAVGYEPNQTKEARIRYSESLMTHAMLITAVHIDEKTNKPIRYKVENSWGKDIGKDGYFVMTQKYFEEYCYQIVVDIDELPEDLANKYKQEDKKVIKLPIWDPMGSLAQ